MNIEMYIILNEKIITFKNSGSPHFKKRTLHVFGK